MQTSIEERPLGRTQTQGNTSRYTRKQSPALSKISQDQTVQVSEPTAIPTDNKMAVQDAAQED